MEKTSLILLIGLSVYLWNRYIVPFAVKKVVLMNPSNDWLKRQQDLIVRGFQAFYWSVFILMAFKGLISLLNSSPEITLH